MFHACRLIIALALLPVEVPRLAAQPDQGIEVYGMSGVFSPAISRGYLKPEVGAGVLLPVWRKWAILADVTFGFQHIQDGIRNSDRKAVFYRRNPQLVNRDVWRERYVTVRPSIIRLWRTSRLDIYSGVGLGLEAQRNRWHFQQVSEKWDAEAGQEVGLGEYGDSPYGTLYREEGFTTGAAWFLGARIIGSFGVRADISPRIALRVGYSCLLGYFDEPLSGAIEVGAGYRF